MKLKSRLVGLHLRVAEILPDIILLAKHLNLTMFQSFLSIKGSGKKLLVNKHHIQKFVSEVCNFETIFFMVHIR